MNYKVIDVDTKEEIYHLATSANRAFELEKDIITIEFTDDSDFKKYNGKYKVIEKKYKFKKFDDGGWSEYTTIHVKKMTMLPYKKRPIIVEAAQWFKMRDVAEAGIRGWNHSDRFCEQCGVRMMFHGVIDTYPNSKAVCPGDFIVKGDRGDYFRCAMNTFKAKHEEVK